MRLAVVGLGWMGMLHARTLSGLPDVTVIGVEVDPTAAAAAAHELGIEVVDTVAAALDRCDAVVVALPDHLHVDATITALAAAKPVLVEKPLATSSADGQRILAADEAGRLMVGHVLRFDERLRELKRRLDAGALGELRYVRIHRSNSVASGERIGARASVLEFLGVHDLDLLLWLTGQDVTGVTANARRAFTDNWDVVTAGLTLSGGTLAQLENHWLIHRASARGCLAGVELFGDRGTALVDLSTDELQLTTDDEPRTKFVDSRNWTHDPGVQGGSLRRQDAAFLDAVRTGAPMPITGADGLRAVRAVELINAALE
ncbi:Gfo/Idh/MocA family protein [Microlunatus sp. Y2014]|uniref:Gfo/Idh/MocA family protein n=1 Tax=Microlunatus sp. Y2014 TaxID=3418488 RepID=UPI003DA73A8C